METQSSLLQIFHLRDVLKSSVKCSDADRLKKALRVLKIEVDQPKYITSTMFEEIKKHMDEGPVLFLIEKKTKNLIEILSKLKVVSLQEESIFDIILSCQESLDDFSEVLEILKVDREEGLSMPSLLPEIFETLYEEMEDSFKMYVWDRTDILLKTLSQHEKLGPSLVKAYGPFLKCQRILSGMEPGKTLKHALEALGISIKTLAQEPIIRKADNRCSLEMFVELSSVLRKHVQKKPVGLIEAYNKRIAERGGSPLKKGYRPFFVDSEIVKWQDLEKRSSEESEIV